MEAALSFCVVHLKTNYLSTWVLLQLFCYFKRKLWEGNFLSFKPCLIPSFSSIFTVCSEWKQWMLQNQRYQYSSKLFFLTSQCIHKPFSAHKKSPQCPFDNFVNKSVSLVFWVCSVFLIAASQNHKILLIYTQTVSI